MPEQVKALFGIDPDSPAEVFEGFHIPWNRWNGWACPSFEKAQAERVMAWYNANPGEEGSRMYWDGDVIVHFESIYADEQPDYEPVRYSPDAAGRYPVGSHSWTWSEVEPPVGMDIGEWLIESARTTELYVRAYNRALHAAYDKGAGPRDAGWAARQAGDEAIAADVRYKDPAYVMPAWFAVSDNPQEAEFAEHAWLLMTGVQQRIRVDEHDGPAKYTGGFEKGTEA